MRNDEQQPYQGPQSNQPYSNWTYADQEQPPMHPTGPPPINRENSPPGSFRPMSNTPYNPANDPTSQPLQETYYPDLTMDMGNSLGYGQSIQHRAISMPQPTQSLPKQRLQQLSRERVRRQQEKLAHSVSGPRQGRLVLPGRRDASPFSPTANARGIPVSPPVAVLPEPELRPAAEPTQNTAMIQREKMARASSVISGAFMVSSLLGLLQTFLFTYIFGRGIAGESYLQAYLLPNLIFTVIAGGALSSAFIPVFTAYATKEADEKTAWHIASSALNISVVCMIVLSLIAFLLAPMLVPLYSRPEEVSLIVTLTRIMLLQAIVLGSGVIVGAVLNTKQDFTRTALGSVLYNVGLILGLIPGFFMTFHMKGSPGEIAVYVATWGVVLGAILQVGVQIPGLSRVGMRYSFVFDWRHPGVMQIARQMVPRIINAVMLSFSTAVDRLLLSLLSGGLINAYLQAFSILLLPVSLFGSSVSTAAFPSLAGYVAKGRLERVRNIITETLRGILFLTIPSGVGLVVLAFPICQVLLEHGNFDLLATRYASVVLLFFALGLPGLAAVEILTRSFYALQDSRTPVTISVLQFILKIALSFMLVDLSVFGVQWGLGALAISTSIAGTFEAFILFFLLSHRVGDFERAPLFTFFRNVFIAAGAMAVILLILRPVLDHMIDTTSMPKLYIPGILMALVKLAIELGVGSLTFLVAARLLKMEEMNTGLVRRVLNMLHVPWL